MTSNNAILARLGLVVAIALGMGGVLSMNAADVAGTPPAATVMTAPVATQASYTLPLAEGYGISSCMATGETCGSDVADAVCASHGYVSAASFGKDAAGEAVTIDCKA